MKSLHEIIEENYGYHLPIFPCFYGLCNEDRIERTIERLIDFADASLLSGKSTQDQYDRWMKALDLWSQRCFSSIHSNPERHVTP